MSYRRSWRAFVVAIVATCAWSCGGGSGGSAPQVTGFSPATIAAGTPTDFVVTGTGFQFPYVGDALIVRFHATTGTPFDGGTSDVMDVPGARISPTEIRGSYYCGPITADIDVWIEIIPYDGHATWSSAGAVCTVTAGTPTGGPVLVGAARYRDVDHDATADSGDELILTFDRELSCAFPTQPAYGPSGTPATGLVALTSASDSLGVGATIGPGPFGNMLTVTLGNGASLMTRHAFTPESVEAYRPSGLEVLGALGAYVVAAGGSDPVGPSGPVDVAADFVDATPSLYDLDATDVAVGDFDGDGTPDVAIARYSRGVDVRLGGRDGTFTPWLRIGYNPSVRTGFSETFNATAVAVGDMNGDGWPDVVVGTRDQGVRAYSVRGGTATLLGYDSSDAIHVNDVALGDGDRDGDLDVVAACTDSVSDGPATQYALRNDGTGALSAAALPYTARGYAVALADVDRDGDLDLFVGGLEAEAILLFDSQIGFFQAPTASLNLGDVYAAEFADLDRDGDADLVVATSSGFRVQRNDRSNGFTDVGAYGAGYGQSLALADVDRDGFVDVLFGAPSPHARVWFGGPGDASIAFFDVGVAIPSDPSGDGSGLAVADLDRDGDLDVVAVGYSADGHVGLGSVSGTFGSGVMVPGVGTYGPGSVHATVVGDLNRDGVPDWFDGDDNQSSIFVSFSGTWVPRASPFPTGAHVAVSTGDLDRDGDLDLVSVLAGGLTQISLNDGAGNFGPPNAVGDAQAASILLFDLDRDGILDLVQGFANGGVSVHWGDGNAAFGSSTALSPVASTVTSIAAADLRRVGRFDLIVGGSGGAMTFEQIGPRDYLAPVSFHSDAVVGIVVADLDRNGVDDVALCGAAWANALVDPRYIAANEGAIHWYLNDGDGWFYSGGEALHVPSNTFTGIAAGDLDADGDVDFVTTHWSGSAAATMVVTVTPGRFLDDPFVSGEFDPTQSTAVALADFDLDGDLDAVVGTPFGAGRLVFHPSGLTGFPP